MVGWRSQSTAQNDRPVHAMLIPPEGGNHKEMHPFASSETLQSLSAEEPPGDVTGTFATRPPHQCFRRGLPTWHSHPQQGRLLPSACPPIAGPQDADQRPSIHRPQPCRPEHPTGLPEVMVNVCIPRNVLNTHPPTNLQDGSTGASDHDGRGHRQSCPHGQNTS